VAGDLHQLLGAVWGLDLRRMLFVVLRRIGPHSDPSRPMEEQSDWPAHAAFMDGLVDAGFVILGEAESEDAVRCTLARDPWNETHLADRHDRSVDDPARRAAHIVCVPDREAAR
jgi:hypothetical protein